MTDIWNKQKRSEVMSRIRSHGNKSTEVRLMAIFRKAGIKGWRRGQLLFGRPDFVFPKSRLTVFVDGCFWHGCPKHTNTPDSNHAFWKRKLTANKKRDQLVAKTLRVQGWRVLRVWEHELVRRNEKRCVSRLLRALRKGQKNIVGAQVKAVRAQQEPVISQAELSTRLSRLGVEIDRAGIAKIETGTRRVHDFELVALSRALAVAVNRLLSEPRS